MVDFRNRPLPLGLPVLGVASARRAILVEILRSDDEIWLKHILAGPVFLMETVLKPIKKLLHLVQTNGGITYGDEATLHVEYGVRPNVNSPNLLTTLLFSTRDNDKGYDDNDPAEEESTSLPSDSPVTLRSRRRSSSVYFLRRITTQMA